MKVLVTGGAGFIGSHIVDALVAKGHEILVVDDLSSGDRSQVNKQATLVVADIRSVEAQQSVRSFAPEVVVLAAAQMAVKKSMDDPRFDVDVNIVGQVNVLEALPKNAAKPPHVVFFSTGGAMYGAQKTFPADEKTPAEPESIYGTSKLAGELYMNFWRRIWGITLTIVRPGNVYGPRQNPHGEAGVVAIFAKKIIAGESPIINGDGSITRDYIYVKDVVAAVLASIENRAQGTFNIGTGRETSVLEIFNHIRELCGTSVKPVHGAHRPGDSLRVSIDPGLAKRTFGWAPEYSIAKGLAETVEWFKNNR
jgi:UDP-glucose 4-epimerase